MSNNLTGFTCKSLVDVELSAHCSIFGVRAIMQLNLQLHSFRLLPSFFKKSVVKKGYFLYLMISQVRILSFLLLEKWQSGQMREPSMKVLPFLLVTSFLFFH